MDLQVKDSVAEFLGVHIERNTATSDEGVEIEKITLLQTGLTDRIIAALGLTISFLQDSQNSSQRLISARIT